eukprot:gnl/TRDRNA2_/TRDRNA2_196565_c0_seq1.p1 gnl/TRDRNA2_/TRDRNA2_196565_c0~~gnl/TRDRNA2_/TRDRNA2_196565_c0_seq1.p1  ORF type:complete len:245 (-),score=38.78 gnl/TRDRNA2_/TRDRNA2_196565_c0_seq1:120-821(-)
MSSPTWRQTAAVAGAAAATAAVATAGVAWLLWKRSELDERRCRSRGESTGSQGGSNTKRVCSAQTLAAIREVAQREDPTLVPPFPDSLCRLLATGSQCQLATVNEDNTPHLSLMRFSYVEGQDLLVMTTRRNTAKFTNIERHKEVAVILHDFPRSPGDQTCVSVTVKGLLKIESGSQAEWLRKLHADNHPGYEQFIVGDNIAVISIKILQARVCNMRDEVSVWDRNSGTSPLR